MTFRPLKKISGFSCVIYDSGCKDIEISQCDEHLSDKFTVYLLRYNLEQDPYVQKSGVFVYLLKSGSVCILFFFIVFSPPDTWKPKHCCWSNFTNFVNRRPVKGGKG